MAAKSLSVSTARKQFSHLVDGVSRGRAVLIGIKEYQELSQKARAYDQLKKRSKPFTVKGSLELCCSSEELLEGMR